MKISYGEKIKMFDDEGSVYRQRIRVTEKMYNQINQAIRAEIMAGYPNAGKYAQSENWAKMYLNPLTKSENGICYLNLTHSKFLARFEESKGRILLDRNSYIQVEG